jgi:hypothetical protein
VLADHVCAAPAALIVSTPWDEEPRLSEPGDTAIVPLADGSACDCAVDGTGRGSCLAGRRGGESGGLPCPRAGSGWIILSKRSSLALALAVTRGSDRTTVVGAPTGTAPAAPAPARRGMDGPPAELAGRWPRPRV